jgi:hypothetical protein
MLELVLPILVGVVAALAMLGLVRKSRAMSESDDGRSLAAVAASRAAGWVRAIVDSRTGGPRTLRPSRPSRPSRLSLPTRSTKAGEDPKPEPVWVKAAGPQTWREGKDIGCEQCAPSWKLGMKTCIRCGRRLADVFTAGGK